MLLNNALHVKNESVAPNIDYGKELLGCLMKDNNCLDLMDGLEPKHFSNYGDRQLFRAMSAYIKKGEPLTVVSLDDCLSGVKTNISAPHQYVLEINNNTISAANAAHTAHLLIGQYNDNERKRLSALIASNDMKEAKEALEELLKFNYSHAKEADEKALKITPLLDRKAYYGFTGELVDILCDGTEVIPELALISTLTRFVASIPRDKLFMSFGADVTTTSMYSLCVAPTGSGKGLSESSVASIFKSADELGEAAQAEPKYRESLKGLSKLTAPAHSGGLSSGEGFVYAIRDEILNDEGDPLVVGVKDKRLLVVEYEFSNVLRQFRRPENVLSIYLRNNFDGKPLKPLTKNNRTGVECPRACLVGHITPHELLEEVQSKSISNGELNRCFIGLAFPVAPQPLPKALSTANRDYLAGKVKNVLDWIIRLENACMKFSDEAAGMWADLYIKERTTKYPAAEAFLFARIPYYMKMFSMLFAAMDESLVIEVKHIEAAKALTDYMKASVRYLFNTEISAAKIEYENSFDERVLSIIKELVNTSEKGMTTRSKIQRKYRDIDAGKLNPSLERLAKTSPPKIEIISTGKNSFDIRPI